MSGGFEPYPLVLGPHLYRRLWGGSRLAAWLGGRGDLPVSGPEGEPVGEAWLLDASSVVLNGPRSGDTLGMVAASAEADLVGETAMLRYGPRVPLLAKFIDAAQDLSVQVHPDDAYALREHPGSGHLGKTEAWFLLDSARGASVLWGFRRPLTEQEVRQAVAERTLADLMHRLPVARGSVVVNPAGTVHAVGAGCFLFEIQQASDLTYRLFDYGRLAADGRPRELHLDRALAVADLSGAPPPANPVTAVGDGFARLVALPEFVLDHRVVMPGETREYRTERRSLEILVSVRGELTVSGGGEEATVREGGTVVLPAALGTYRLTGDAEVLRSAVGA